jgi:RimJ/RimL family protein N-acetyltransferase
MNQRRNLQQRGNAEVTAEVDVTNTASNRLLTGLGARPTGGFVELVRRRPAGGQPPRWAQEPS